MKVPEIVGKVQYRLRFGAMELLYGRSAYYPPEGEMRKRLDKNGSRDQILGYVAGTEYDVGDLVRWPFQRGGELTDIGILRHLVAGNISIQPFHAELLQSNGYDVRVGGNYWEMKDSDPQGVKFARLRLNDTNGSAPILDPLDTDNIRDFFDGPKTATTLQEILAKFYESRKALPPELVTKNILRGVEADESVIIIPPAKMFLGHTVEFIGGRKVVDTSISGKSTSGRIGIELCSDANKGDVGFQSRWTLEIANKHNCLAVPLIVGQPYATLTFLEVVMPARDYGGVYQNGRTYEELKAGWTPEQMLPKMKRKKITD